MESCFSNCEEFSFPQNSWKIWLPLFHLNYHGICGKLFSNLVQINWWNLHFPQILWNTVKIEFIYITVKSCFLWNLWKKSIIIVEFSLLRVDEFPLLYCLILTKYCKECKESTYLRKSIYISECWVAPIRPQECSTSIAVILLADPHYWWLSIMRTWKW